MTFKQCVENFPRFRTLVGTYNTEQSFTVLPGCTINNIEQWPDNPFWEDSSCYSFVVFEPQDKKFVVWTFSYFHVCGYINETDDPEEFYPAIYSKDFGWEKIDPWDPQFKEQVTTSDDELAIEMGWPLDEIEKRKWRREQVAYLFDAESYLNGFTFTSAEALKNFVKERQDLL